MDPWRAAQSPRTWPTQPALSAYYRMQNSQRQQIRGGLTPEQREAEERAQLEIQLRYQATERARGLLLSCLTPEQRGMYERERKIRVAGSCGGIYEIHEGRMHNIYKLNMQGEKIEELCITPQMHVPLPDVMLSQKFMVETDETEFRRMANIWNYRNRQMIHQSPVQYRH